MGLRTWIYEKTGIKLKKFREISPHLSKPTNQYIGNMTIGNYSYFNAIHIGDGTSIGRYCSIAWDVIIAPDDHPTTWLSSSPFQFNKITHQNTPNFESVSNTTIGNDVWIGRNAIIMSGLSVGDGAIIGAGAIVTKDVPPYAIVGSVPAKIIKYRFDEPTIKELLKLQWWEFEKDVLLDAQIQFNDIQKAIEQIKKLKLIDQ